METLHVNQTEAKKGTKHLFDILSQKVHFLKVYLFLNYNHYNLFFLY